MYDFYIFDFDGTLVDSLSVWDFIWTEFGKTYLNDENFRPSKEADKTVRTMVLDDAMEYIHKTCAIGNSGKELTIKANELLIIFYKEKAKLKKGASELLKYLEENGINVYSPRSDMFFERKEIKIALGSLMLLFT